jgi:hypothetical protein
LKGWKLLRAIRRPSHRDDFASDPIDKGWRHENAKAGQLSALEFCLIGLIRSRSSEGGGAMLFEFICGFSRLGAMPAKLQGGCQQEMISRAVIQADERLWVAGDSRQEICTK